MKKEPISIVERCDNMEFMAKFPDKYFDLAVVDIEYCIGASKPSDKPNFVKQKNGNKLKINNNIYSHKDWDFKMSSPDYFLELFRCSKNQIIFGGNYYGFSGGYLVWDKLNGNSDQFGVELAWLSFTKRTDIVYFLWSGMFQGIYCGKNLMKAVVQQGDKSLNEERIHPTQKPIPLYGWIYKEYSNLGNKILDTHLGSQSSRVAAYKLGFDFYGCELDEDYFKEGCARFDRECKGIIEAKNGAKIVQQSLF